MQAYKLKVSELKSLTPLTRVIRLDLGGNPFSFQAGQYVSLGVDLAQSQGFSVRDGKNTFQERPFSISSNPLDKDFVEITVFGADNGFMADYFLNYMKPGEEVSLTGPLGDFHFQEKRGTKNVMLLGGGSGVMPLVSIASYISGKNLPVRTHMLFSFKDEERIIFRDIIENLTEKENITSNITLTQNSWDGSTGRIDVDKIRESGLPLDETDFYICGPRGFKEDMMKILTNKLNISSDRIFQ